MSLYDQFHSDINKKFMYDMIKDVIQKEIYFDISKDPENYNIYLSTFKKIFEENNVEEIEEMNKFLLDYNLNIFSDKIKSQQQETPIVKDDFEKLLQEREQQDLTSTLLTKDVNKPEEKEPQIMSNSTLIVDNHAEIPRTNSTEINNFMDFQTPKMVEETPIIDTVKDTVKKEVNDIRKITINSSKRTNINSSRYNYKIDLEKLNIDISELKILKQLILPIEDNYIFSIPILIVNIPELNYSQHMQQDNIIEGINRKYGIYKPIGEDTIKTKKMKGSKITLDIRDISEKKYTSPDILKVNIIEFKNSRIYFTCSLIHKLDYQIGDFIKVINNNSHNQLFHIFQEPLKIKKIHDNILICEYRGLEDIENNIFTNIDMKIMNTSNQNILYFN
jgi:hypothetical protein